MSEDQQWGDAAFAARDGLRHSMSLLLGQAGKKEHRALAALCLEMERQHSEADPDNDLVGVASMAERVERNLDKAEKQLYMDWQLHRTESVELAPLFTHVLQESVGLVQQLGVPFAEGQEAGPVLLGMAANHVFRMRENPDWWASYRWTPYTPIALRLADVLVDRMTPYLLPALSGGVVRAAMEEMERGEFPAWMREVSPTRSNNLHFQAILTDTMAGLAWWTAQASVYQLVLQENVPAMDAEVLPYMGQLFTGEQLTREWKIPKGTVLMGGMERCRLNRLYGAYTVRFSRDVTFRGRSIMLQNDNGTVWPLTVVPAADFIKVVRAASIRTDVNERRAITTQDELRQFTNNSIVLLSYFEKAEALHGELVMTYEV